MVWTSPKMCIRELRGQTRFRQTQTTPGDQRVEMIGTGFNTGPGESQFMFVRATDASRALEPSDLIPCKVMGTPKESSSGGAEILQGFELSFSIHQRAGGSYHLVACCDAEENSDGMVVNNATVYEFALVIVALSSEELEAERRIAAAGSDRR